MYLQDEVVEDLERDPAADMKRMVFNLELKRIRYLLRLYLRTRLHKVEMHATHTHTHAHSGYEGDLAC